MTETTARAPTPAARRLAMPAMRAWHAVIAGGFLVAYLSGDSDRLYIMHQVAGYTVLAAVVVRLLVAAFARTVPWRMPRASLAGTREWLRSGRGRHPLFAWLALALFVTVGAAAASGMAAHWLTWVEDLHEGLSTVSLWVVLGHAGFILVMVGGKRHLSALWRRLTASRRAVWKESTR
ncbi:cytochrome b/b6 domain-containing protein [Caenispirillum bisanense]|uniref:cytochrome b/b6 domain-containing protein n=1 Tax=Caenispirillum bisanense TaxID=414052 RepID=UPI0031D731BA